MSSTIILNYTFDRNFIENSGGFHFIGSGEIGGKAGGLAFIKKILTEKIDASRFSSIEIYIPQMSVLRTDIFDAFLERNKLYNFPFTDERDDNIARAFLKADLPVEILGDLRSISEKIKTPLAIRSSSLLEDRKDEPFAGIYATKMISNSQPDISTRFKKLSESIKYVFASTFFKAARDYISATNYTVADEKMAVIIQKVVGETRNKRFYPSISGVARSFNYYASGRAKPEDGVVNLALGLGKTIVDGGISWTYSPKYPKISPPFANPQEQLKNTQTKFWVIDVAKTSNYNPLKETEYLMELGLKEAEYDGNIKYSASTYNSASERINIGIGIKGPRILNFAPLLVFNDFKFNTLIDTLLKVCEDALGNPVEIEFAVTFPTNSGKMQFGFLQVRPMVVSSENVDLDPDELFGENVILNSNRVMGNGIIENISDIVYVKPNIFNKKNTQKIASEIELINKKLISEKRKYVIIGFGRWGSSDPWLGIPIEWGQIAGAKVIVESTLPDMNVELSQGSHFFHNLTSFKVSYFSIHHSGDYKINWEWLENQKISNETEYLKHISTPSPIKIKVDGKKGLGVIYNE
jgi:hypothetical protein